MAYFNFLKWIIGLPGYQHQQAYIMDIITLFLQYAELPQKESKATLNGCCMLRVTSSWAVSSLSTGKRALLELWEFFHECLHSDEDADSHFRHH